MGLNDTAEQLEAAQQQSVVDERRILALEAQLEHAEEQLRERARAYESRGQQLDELRRELERRDYRITELEYESTRAESALADRLQHDAHARPTHPQFDLAELRELLWTDERIRSVYPDPDSRHRLADRIAALVQLADGVLITDEEAALAIRAARHSAESIAAVLAVDPSRLHPDVAPYVDRLTDLADRLEQETR